MEITGKKSHTKIVKIVEKRRVHTHSRTESSLVDNLESWQRFTANDKKKKAQKSKKSVEQAVDFDHKGCAQKSLKNIDV